MLPSLPIPEPLRGEEIPSFTHFSVVVRLPDIARQMLADHQFPAQVVARVENLIAEIPAGPIRRLDIPLAPDADEWNTYVEPYLGQNWLTIPWFFAEEYFYHRILEATGYFQAGSGLGIDPYTHQKQMGLKTTRREIQAIIRQANKDAESLTSIQALSEALRKYIVIDLWGNQNDLSMWPATGDSETPDPEDSPDQIQVRDAQEHVLDNHLELAVDHLLKVYPSKARFDFVLDNAGFELVCDLVLVDSILAGWAAAEVVLHAKTRPVFVSDALEEDIEYTLAFLGQDGEEGAALANRLRKHLSNRRLRIQSDHFWTTPLAMWEMPERLHQQFSRSCLLVSKGDANYRRLLGDRHWAVAAPFAEVVDYTPCPVLALRTLKSEIVVGVSQDKAPMNDSEWMVNGRWGLIQFSPGVDQDSKTQV